jgi:hypothetical protein
MRYRLTLTFPNNLLGNINDYIVPSNWPASDLDERPARLADCKCGPEFAYLVLWVLHPGEMRARGFASRALL